MWKEGDRVRVKQREVTAEDRKSFRYYDHLAGLVGTVQNVYGADEIAVKTDVSTLSRVAKEVHTEAVKRMREKFLNSISEEQKGKMSSEEKNFDAHYMILARSEDLEKA